MLSLSTVSVGISRSLYVIYLFILFLVHELRTAVPSLSSEHRMWTHGRQ